MDRDKERKNQEKKVDPVAPSNISDKEYEFLSLFIVQNLEHARHAENERLTFNSFYMALVAGALAVFGSIDLKAGKNLNLPILLSAIMIVFGLINLFVSLRWQNIFDQHMERAKTLYGILHNSYYKEGIGFSAKKQKNTFKLDQFEGLEGAPAYCFQPTRMRGICCLGRARYLFPLMIILSILFFLGIISWVSKIPCIFLIGLILILFGVKDMMGFGSCHEERKEGADD